MNLLLKTIAGKRQLTWIWRNVHSAQNAWHGINQVPSAIVPFQTLVYIFQEKFNAINNGIAQNCCTCSKFAKLSRIPSFALVFDAFCYNSIHNDHYKRKHSRLNNRWNKIMAEDLADRDRRFIYDVSNQIILICFVKISTDQRLHAQNFAGEDWQMEQTVVFRRTKGSSDQICGIRLNVQ